MRKPRSDALLLNLPEEQQLRLADWLLGGMPYYEAQKQVLDQFGVAVKSLKSFSAFWSDVCGPLLLKRRNQARSIAQGITDEMSKESSGIDRALMDALKQKAFEVILKPNPDPAEVSSVISLALKVRDQEIKVQQIELEREKFKETIRTNIDRGLEALYQEIKENQIAREIFERLKRTVMKEVKAA